MAGLLIRAGDDRLVDPTVVGHKFARQERLRQAGFPVPELCCVPASVFDQVVAPLPAPPPGLDSEQELAQWAASAAGQLAAVTVPPELAAEVRAAAGVLASAEGLVAVRACVVAGADGVGEDGATDAFAGLTESFLYVPGDDVPVRVRDCWASGLRPQSIVYRARRGLPPGSARVAVGIQRMVPGVRSFVAFSRDPRTGAQGCVVAAAHGIGEGVVQERADVDHFFLAPSGEIRTELVVKRWMVADAGSGQPPEVRPVQPELAEPPVLTDDEVRQVGGLATEVAAFFGVPQDIEGTITADGTIHLVQARPVVFAAPAPAAQPAPEPGPPPAPEQVVRWSNHNITESFPGVSSAATFSLARVFYRSVFFDGYRRLGVPRRRLREQEHHLRRMVGLLDGRVYYRLDAWFTLHGQVPGFALVRPWWERSMGLAGTQPRAPAGPRWRALLALPAQAVRLARLPGQTRRFLRWWDALVAGAADLEQWPAERVIAFHRRLWTEAGRRWGVTLVNSFYLLAWATATSTLARRWSTGDTEDAQRLLGGLLTGGRENRSVLGVRSAIALAEQVNQNPELAVRVVQCGSPGEPAEAIWHDIATGRYGAELAAAAQEHLRRYGDRALHDLKLEEPSPRQRPSMVVTMIQPMVRGALTVAASRVAERASRTEAEQELRRHCRGRSRRMVIRGLAAGLRSFVKSREDTRYCRSQLFGLTRRVLERLGELLVAAGRLESPTDVYDLTVEEVLGAFDGTLIDSDLPGLVRRRREERQAAAARPGFEVELRTPRDAPVDIAGLPRLTPEPAAAGSAGAAAGAPPGEVVAADELRGLPSSNGVVRGQARVVLDPSVAPESCRDRIIVAKETDPGWLFLMMAARGMVVERGTLLSHTAITGRLLGIPTVVAVPGATTRISDGSLIEVDGGAGRVRILPDGAAA